MLIKVTKLCYSHADEEYTFPMEMIINTEAILCLASFPVGGGKSGSWISFKVQDALIPQCKRFPNGSDNMLSMVTAETPDKILELVKKGKNNEKNTTGR